MFKASTKIQSKNSCFFFLNSLNVTIPLAMKGEPQAKK